MMQKGINAKMCILCECRYRKLGKNWLKKRGGVRLQEPYKLCDYRPAYGEIFSDLIQDAAFWGYGDMDLIFGDISYIVNDDTMNRFDIIGCGGHFTCVRNTELFTNAYKMVPRGLKSYVFREVSQTDESMIFDEWGFRRILQTIPNIRMMDFYTDTNERICDVLPPRKEDGGRMCRRFHDDEEFYLKVKGGHVVLHGLKDKQWYEKEFAMCHLQKRKITIQTDIEQSFIIHRLSFLPETSEASVRSELESQESHHMVVSPTGKTKMDSIKKMFRQIKVSHKPIMMKCCRMIRDKLTR